MQTGAVAVSVAEVSREVELRRHTDADGDVLTAEGVAAALEMAPASRAATTSRSRRARSGRRRRLPASSRRSANQCRVANEAAILGLTREVVAPLANGAGVRVLTDHDDYQVETIDYGACALLSLSRGDYPARPGERPRDDQ